MASRNERAKQKQVGSVDEGSASVAASGSDTPLWNKYYQEVRKRIRFPRYYKRALNW